MREFGRHDEGPGEFSDPYAIATSGNRLFCVWDRNARISVLGHDGTVVARRSEVKGDAFSRIISDCDDRLGGIDHSVIVVDSLVDGGQRLVRLPSRRKPVR